MTMTMKATVSDIARSCGLSTATVDRVLNNRAGASAANRQRVMEAAKQLGYLPVVDRIVVMRRGKVVADDIDPKKTTVAEVERIITGMSDKEIRDAIVEGKPSHG